MGRCSSLKEKLFKHTVQCNSEHRKAKWGQMYPHAKRLSTFLGGSSYTTKPRKGVGCPPFTFGWTLPLWCGNSQYYIVVPIHTYTGDEFGYIITRHPDRKAPSCLECTKLRCITVLALTLKSQVCALTKIWSTGKQGSFRSQKRLQTHHCNIIAFVD